MTQRPHRVQRRRTRGWKMPPNTVSVTRPGPWGNPYSVGPNLTPHDAVEHFRLWVNRTIRLPHGDYYGYPTAQRIKRALRGKNLACWCELDQPCHADVLLEIAND
jgi:hypothetical protein